LARNGAQALRVALPAWDNEHISIVKPASLVSVMSLQEILFVSQRLLHTKFQGS
jgi:ABC-type amino acid transport system permease subunit